jgi:acetyl esterase
MIATAGHPWLSVEYRLGGRARAADADDDLQAAVAFTRCHAGDAGVDPERIVLLGEDAGADLAARAALRRTPGVIGAVLIGGLYSGQQSEYFGDRPRPLEPSSPRSPRPPRFLVVHGSADTDAPVAQVEAWCRGARTGGAPCELVAVEGAGHRPENWWPDQWGYKARVASWLGAAAGGHIETMSQRPPADLTSPLPPGLHKRIGYAGASPALTGSGAPPPVARTLDAWLPRDRRHPAVPVILLHGGGWEAGDRVTYITPLFEPLARAGFAWFSVDYRLTPAVRHQDQLDDVRAAIGFVKSHARAFGVDPRRVILVGESASAQMATLLAAEETALAGVVSFYGVYDFVSMVTDAAPRSLAARLFGRTVLDDQTRQTLRAYSPLHRAVRGMPPVLLIHGTNERLWEQGIRMAARLRELGVDHDLVRLDGAPHGMENWEGHPEWQFYKSRLISWIRLRAAPPARR